MKLLIARHGEPNGDALTEKGRYEAELLADKLCTLDIKAFYCSPLIRANQTAKPTLDRLGRTAEILPWLHEFQGTCFKPNVPGEKSIVWDWLPQDWTKQKLFYDKDRWFQAPELQDTNVHEEYLKVVNGFDALMARHGYVREDGYYRVVEPNNDTIVLFCHLGVQAVFVSHILGVSPIIMLQNFAPAPSSVTTIVTEERVEGIAGLRILSYGSTEHLYVAGEEPSFHARFCECYSNSDQRH